MKTIAIVPENQGARPSGYRAIAGKIHSVGRAAGEALDAITAQLGESETGTLVVVQQMRPDQFFTADQQQRLRELMDRWRGARDAGIALPPDEYAELAVLVAAELGAAASRAAALVRGLAPGA